MADTMLIYHGNCPDGFMAATIFKKAASKKVATVQFHAGSHREAPPDVSGKEVVMVDFSYKRAVILAMAEQAKSILIVDHHVSAEADLVELPDNVKTVFDMDKSGAGLAWDVFMPGLPAPMIVLYVQAMDLWRLKAYPKLGEVTACLNSHPFDFDLWTEFLDADQAELIAAMASEGASIQRAQMKNIHEIIESGSHEIKIAGRKVPAVNVPKFMSSAAAGILAVGQPFAACYHLGDGYVDFSLRSTKDIGEDVSKIAALYGGGGHKHAAGFSIKYDGSEIADALSLELSDN